MLRTCSFRLSLRLSFHLVAVDHSTLSPARNPACIYSREKLDWGQLGIMAMDMAMDMAMVMAMVMAMAIAMAIAMVLPAGLWLTFAQGRKLYGFRGLV